MPSSATFSTLQLRLCWAGAIVLAAGLLAAIGIYATATDEVTSLQGYEISAGEVRAITADSSRRYRHELERNGGKMAVLMDDFMRWFGGLWRGRQLAYTLAFLAMGVSLACFWLADSLTSRPLPRKEGEEG